MVGEHFFCDRHNKVGLRESSMRIIAGTAKGRRLASPPTRKTRPTTDRIRESLFSIIGDVTDAVVVDAFAGSGALGLEALSRGARKCFFFDTSRAAVKTVRENIGRVGVEEKAVLRRCSFERGLTRFVEGTPDLWFFDPPYGTSLAKRGLRAMISAPDKVTPGALVVWESGGDEEIPSFPEFAIVDTREYGTTRLVFLRRVTRSCAEGNEGV